MLENWFNQETKNVIEKLNSNLEKGLTEEQVKEAREKHGFNELEAKKKQLETELTEKATRIKNSSILIIS